MRKHALYYAWLIALVATFGSLWYSFLFAQEPCPLCWYQRVAIFPLIGVLAVACYKESRKIGIYLYPQILFGFFISTYQIVKGYFPSLYFAPLCGPYSCSGKDQEILGVFILPWLGLFASLLIGFFLWQASKYVSEDNLGGD